MYSLKSVQEVPVMQNAITTTDLFSPFSCITCHILLKIKLLPKGPIHKTFIQKLCPAKADGMQIVQDMTGKQMFSNNSCIISGHWPVVLGLPSPHTQAAWLCTLQTHLVIQMPAWEKN